MSYIPTNLRREVGERANNCCEYCHLHQEDYAYPFHIEHITAQKHEGETLTDNLALSCPTCNINKGSDIASNDPITGEITRLFNPRTQDWDEHFRINFDAAVIEALTAEGRVTIRVLKMNNQEQVTLRKVLIKIRHYPCTKS
jgi:HNH endonuclease